MGKLAERQGAAACATSTSIFLVYKAGLFSADTGGNQDWPAEFNGCNFIHLEIPPESAKRARHPAPFLSSLLNV